MRFKLIHSFRLPNCPVPNVQCSLSQLALLCLLSTAGHIAAQSPGKMVALRPDKIVDQQAAFFFSHPGHIGLSIGIIKESTRYTYNYGTPDKTKRTLPTPHTLYEIASLTKTFTGILLAHAVLEKKIDLDDDIRKYLKGPYPNLTFKGHPIRIIHLANHTAGLTKNIPGFPIGSTPDQILAFYGDLSKERFLAALSKIRPDTLPGTRFNYSNADAQLLGIILEDIYHLSYEALIKRYITGPHHMRDTRTEVDPADTFRFAKGYDGQGNLMPKLLQMRRLPAAAYLKSTIADLLTYAQMNLDEKDPTIALAHQPTFFHSAEQDDDIGLFWFSQKLPDGYRRVRHAGGSFGTTSYCALYPELHTGIVCLANDAGPDTERELTQLSDEIIRQLQLRPAP